jgi:hypothetical protein
MAKSREEKVAQALSDGVDARTWDHDKFAYHVLRQPLKVQWEILRTIFVLVKAWRRNSDLSNPYKDLSFYTDNDADMVKTEAEVDSVDLNRWDT